MGQFGGVPSPMLVCYPLFFWFRKIHVIYYLLQKLRFFLIYRSKSYIQTDNTSGFTALHIPWHLEKLKIVKDMRNDRLYKNSKQKD